MQQLTGVTELFYKDSLNYLKAVLHIGDVRQEKKLVQRAVQLGYIDYLKNKGNQVKHCHIAQAKKELFGSIVQDLLASLAANEVLVLLAIKLLEISKSTVYGISTEDVKTKALEMAVRNKNLSIDTQTIGFIVRNHDKLGLVSVDPTGRISFVPKD